MQRKHHRPNSKRNPWRNTWQDKTRKRITGRKVAAILVLVIAVPLFCLGMANGVLARAADVYQYNLRSTQAVSQGSRLLSEEKLVALLGDFMTGKTDEFSLLEEVEYEPQDVFSAEDERVMREYRRVATIELYGGIAGLVLVAGMLLLLIRWKEKDIHRLAIKWAGASLALFLGLETAAKIYAPLRSVTYGRLIHFSLPEDDYLRELVGQSFAVQFSVMVAIVCVVLYLLLLWLTWQVAGKRKLFRGSVWEEKRR